MPSPTDWSKLQDDAAAISEDKIYYRVWTSNSTAADPTGDTSNLVSTNPGWLWPNLENEPPYAVLTADGKSDY